MQMRRPLTDAIHVTCSGTGRWEGILCDICTVRRQIWGCQDIHTGQSRYCLAWEFFVTNLWLGENTVCEFTLANQCFMLLWSSNSLFPSESHDSRVMESNVCVSLIDFRSYVYSLSYQNNELFRYSGCGLTWIIPKYWKLSHNWLQLEFFSCYVSFWTWITSGKEFSVIRHNVSHH